MFRNIKKNNSGFMLLGSLSIVIFLSIVLSAAMFSSEMQLKEDTQRNSIQEAFYAAEAGLDMAIFELRKNSEWRPGEDEQPQVQDVRLNRTLDDDETTVGFYSVVVKDGGVFNGWETVWIQSIGRDALNDLTRVVVARAIIDSHARFLVSTLGNLRIESRASINADILGTDVYFEVNPSLEPPENAIYVTGGVFYIRDIYGEDNPNVFGEDDGAITSYKIPSITFAGVNLNRYREIAVELEASGKGIYHGGDLTVDLNTLGGLNAAPIIIFAEGDITIFGEYNFSPLVVSSGNIFISGNIEPD
ncbi:MAG: pilus assembly PilX N-terminal domain-containing protein, partial [Candidatus Omnitrophica bacterium]|nr:pilus assembly PilX N-terminal domain-containing protein [Candidatus Omnitrophota bacterium]